MQQPMHEDVARFQFLVEHGHVVDEGGGPLFAGIPSDLRLLAVRKLVDEMRGVAGLGSRPDKAPSLAVRHVV